MAPINLQMRAQGNITIISYNKKDNSSKSTTLQRMKYYPMVLVICYTPATIRRLSELLTNDSITSPFWLAAFQVFFSSLIGVGNAAVYGLSQRSVREKDIEWIKENCPCYGDDKHVTVNFDAEPKHDINLE